MYLKRLQTVGFKSFAERVDIHFNRGLTAIVGPNGSGKSNIIDAIRWVLGEQSARSLRGERMEDIIFQGSDTRNQMNFAEVTLTLDNASETLPLDYEEVSVTRRVYRSGESEFFINKQACRLKDIIDLFIDSGLGKEAFSIIGQGKVEEILSSKADDRRVIFEEAAGVLKYKQRKQEAEFKLKETEENLNRVEDIIYEVEQQIEPLNKQAEKAKQYNNLTDQLKQIEIHLLVTEIDKLHTEWQQVLQEIEKERLNEIKMKTNIQEREAKLTKNRHQLHELDEKITALQNDLLLATEQLEKFEGEKNVLDERLKHFTENKNKLEQEKKVTQVNKQKVVDTLSVKRLHLEKLQQKKQATINKIDVLSKKLHNLGENLAENIKELQAEYIEQLNVQAVTKNERETVKQQLEMLKTNFEKHQAELAHVTETRKQIKEQYESLSNQINTLTTKIDHVKARDNKLKKEYTKLTEQVNKFRRTHHKQLEQLTKLTSRKETLEEMKESYQGYFHGVRSLLKKHEQKAQFNIYGTVFDLIDVPQQYMTAIDTILGAQAQHIVIHTEKDARKAINWLKKEDKGRATFLPINAIRDRSLPPHIIESIQNEAGFIGVASQVIQVDKAFQIVANHLLGNVIVTDTLKGANEIAKKTNRSYRIVTLDGDVVFPGGSMSGGARRKNNQSLFTREKDLQTIIKEIKKQTALIEEITMEIEKTEVRLKQIDQAHQENETIVIENEDELTKLQTTYHQVSIKHHSINNDFTTTESTITNNKEEIAHLHEREQTLAKSLVHVADELETIQTNIADLTIKEQNLQHETEKIKDELHQKEISLAEQEERVKNETNKIDSLQTELNEIDEHYETVKQQLIDLHEIEQSKKEKSVTKQKIEEQLSFRDVTNTMLSEKRNKRVALNEQIEDEQRDLKGEHQQHRQLVSLIQEKEVTANRLDVALDTRLTHLEEEYVITFEKASKQYEKLVNVEEATESVEVLKRQINRLGTVNLGAIKEYERIIERYTFLTEQQQDLLEAKETLYSVIKEMDEEMINRFSTTFTSIQKAFTEVFKELFGGGHAKLTLTDESNLLETGIEIVARPPGKKLRTLDLLSGGEKALTAISLLFAILKVRPVPFVILDEVEAALDEANIVRFAQYLKMYSEEAQFIVISHRKGTMEEADVLYGVTMQESGVSRLVSVKLEDSEELVTAT